MNKKELSLNSDKHKSSKFRTLSFDPINVKVSNDSSKSTVLTFRASDETEVFFGSHYLRPLHGKENIDLAFANSGRAPFLADHNQSLESVLGSILAVRLNLNEKALYMDIEIHDVEQSDSNFSKVKLLKQGKLSNVSIGFLELSSEVSEDTIDDLPVIDVTRYEILELSLVACPANRVGAHRVSQNSDTTQILANPETESTENSAPETNLSNLITETNTMNDKVKTTEKKVETKVELSQDNQVANERTRTSRILEIAASTGLSADKAIKNGQSVEDYRTFALDQLVKKSKETNVQVHAQVDWTQAEKQNYSLGRALNAMATGDMSQAGYEVEISQEIAHQLGQRVKGGSILVPTDALTQFAVTAGTAGSGAELVGETHRGDLMVDALYNKSVVKRAGAIVMPATANFSIPTGEGVAFTWEGETDAVSGQDIDTGSIQFSPKRAVGLVKVSELSVYQSNPASDRYISDQLIKAAGQHLDQAAIAGSGIGNIPRGLLATSGIAAQTLPVPTLAALNNMIADVEDANLEGNTFLSNARVSALLKNTRKVASTDSVMLKAAIDLLGYDHLISRNVPTASNLSSLIFGDFSNIMIGEFGALELAVSNSNEDDFKAGLLAIRATFFADINVLRTGAFSVIDGIDLS